MLKNFWAYAESNQTQLIKIGRFELNTNTDWSQLARDQFDVTISIIRMSTGAKPKKVIEPYPLPRCAIPDYISFLSIW